MNWGKLIVPVGVILSIIACKSTPAVQNGYSARLQGSWQLIRASGGYAGKDQPIKELRNLCIHENKYQVWQRDSMAASGTFTVKDAKWLTNGQQGPALFLERFPFGQQLSLRNDTLQLTDLVYDGYTYIYVKQGGSCFR